MPEEESVSRSGPSPSGRTAVEAGRAGNATTLQSMPMTEGVVWSLLAHHAAHEADETTTPLPAPKDEGAHCSHSSSYGGVIVEVSHARVAAGLRPTHEEKSLRRKFHCLVYLAVGGEPEGRWREAKCSHSNEKWCVPVEQKVERQRSTTELDQLGGRQQSDGGRD